ncbi:MAG: hypothetical protein AAF362_04320 [Pseudomonadota bacterium]
MAERFDKILVVGRSGLGKTKFSTRLGKLTGRKITHLDKHLWGPNWKTKRRKVQLRRKIIDILTSSEQWILEGHYLDDIERRIEKADTVVLFDMPLWRSFYGVSKRWLFSNYYIVDQHPQKKYRLDKTIMKQIINYDMKYLYKSINKFENKNVYIIDNHRKSDSISDIIAEEINRSKNKI